ncbi:M48 family metalloprotease [Crossiella sp. CA-258035]|uniref:M48 family metallopeptidase n=1 Tax=Crossiella sp. CA-258035 TaxID=2981138 RepID=UPI0024BCA223|nr:M48 family metallopeptidase [Crossiella sp. CA-258035]WHT17188.1 M48 family metalloprotease [Crossiella sp. CA-258035]
MISRVLATVRGLLAVGLLAGFYVLAACLVLGYLGLVVLSLHNMTLATNTSVNYHLPVLIAAGGVPVLLGVIRGVLATNSAGHLDQGSVLLTRAQAPLLWRTVEELAERAGAPVPDEIRLTAEANAAVTEDTRMLGLVVGERRLYLGLPLLTGLPLEELKAVLCHELGHFAGRHNRFGAVVYRGALALDTAQEEMGRALTINALARMYAGLIIFAIRGYAWCYAWIAFAVLRRQEIEADRAAAAVAGPEVTGEALRSTLVLMAAWTDFRTRFLDPLAAAGAVPDDPFSAFEAMLDDPDYRDVLAQHRDTPPENAPAALVDTHPPLAQRLDYLAPLPSRANAPRELRPGLNLLGADPGVAARRVAAAMRAEDVKPMPWREWVRLASGSHVDRHLAWLRPAVAELGGPAALSIDTALDLLEAGRTQDLAERLAARAGAEAERGPDLLRTALVSLLGAALVGAGAASWTAPWTGTPRLIVGDPGFELTDLVQRAMDHPREVARLRLHLAALGVDSRTPHPAAEPVGGTTELRLGIADPEIRAAGKRTRNLSLWSAGIVGAAVLLALFVFKEEPKPLRPPGLTYSPFLNRTPIYTPVYPGLPTYRLPPIVLPTLVRPTIRINPSVVPVTPRRTGR